MLTTLLIILSSYLFGSIPFPYLMVKWRLGQDIRTVGNGNVGARNTIRLLGVGPGVAVLLLDAAKGAAAYSMVTTLDDSIASLYIGGAALLLGHCFPLWLGFRGGVGQAAVTGYMVAMWPWAPLVGVPLFLLVLKLLGMFNLGYAIAAVVVLGVAVWRGAPLAQVALPVVLLAAVIIKKLVDMPRQKVILSENDGKSESESEYHSPPDCRGDTSDLQQGAERHSAIRVDPTRGGNRVSPEEEVYR